MDWKANAELIRGHQTQLAAQLEVMDARLTRRRREREEAFLRYDPIRPDGPPHLCLADDETTCPFPGVWWRIERAHGWRGEDCEMGRPLCDWHFLVDRSWCRSESHVTDDHGDRGQYPASGPC